MAVLIKLFIVLFLTSIRCEDDLQDFEFSEPGEVMIAQESRQYQTFVKPPVRIYKPTGITNSHRPQYNLDSVEDDRYTEDLQEYFSPPKKTTEYKSLKQKSRETLIKDAVLRALERKDHVGKFAQILPIIRAMSGNQRVALASLVASQVSTPPGRAPLNFAQVRSMFGNNANTTSDLMLPVLLDMANLIRRAVRPGKEPREVKQPITLPQAQLLRRSFTEDTVLDDEPFDTGVNTNTVTTTKAPRTRRPLRTPYRKTQDKATHNTTNVTTVNNITTENTDDVKNLTRSSTSSTTEISTTAKAKISSRISSDNGTLDLAADSTNTTLAQDLPVAEKLRAFNRFIDRKGMISTDNGTLDLAADSTNTTLAIDLPVAEKLRAFNRFIDREGMMSSDNGTLDLAADSTNTTLSQDLPVAEKPRAFNRFIDRKGNLIRRGTYPPKPSSSARRTTAEPTLSPVLSRRRPPPARKLPVTIADQGNCELFTNSLCLHSEDYPTDLILQSIRRNKAAAGALLADFKDPGEGALDGITAAQEAKYTAEHYLTSNRRGDTANRDFASAGEAGFMCPSTVKYARPQRARATSGQWKYIVNTGEHTQTLRLEKCLKPKESCTYLTDNFKSKCVQVYNYHRLLTWDQQNGLHMDIFKVPTCCSCHIEGYSVSFPPLGQRIHETSNENFPGENLSAEHGNGAFEQVQSSVNRPAKTPFSHSKPFESFPPFSDNHNLLTGSPFMHPKLTDNDELSHLAPSSPMDSYGNSYIDSFNQASSIRNVKRPIGRNPVAASNTFDSATISATLASYLEPPTPSAPAFSFAKDTKLKIGAPFKRGITRNRNRPIRKKIGGPEDLAPSGTSAVENLETLEDFNEDLDEDLKPNINNGKRASPTTKVTATTEKASTSRPHEQKTVKETATIASNGKRINYNYHPIIDFFEEDDKEGNESIDREDSHATFVPATENEWKPMNSPPTRSQTSSVARKKQ